MAQRIIKETKIDGKVQYRVENNRIAGIFPCKWYTDTIGTIDDVQCDAVFSTFKQALAFCDKPKDYDIAKKEIVWHSF